MKQYVMVIALLVVLAAISACSQSAINAQPLNTSVPKAVDVCANITCGKNMYCNSSVCLCSNNFKTCGNKCIAKSSCCADTECSFGTVCKNETCADRALCGLDEQWDSATNECTCADGAKFCPEQGKCIPGDVCCAYTDCRNGQRCAAITYSGTVCVSSGTKKCSVVHEGVPINILASVGSYDVLLKNVLEGERFDLKVGNETLRRIQINESKTIANGSARVYIESMTVFGGYCRDEPD